MFSSDLRHERLKMPNLCAGCGNDTPVSGFEIIESDSSRPIVSPWTQAAVVVAVVLQISGLAWYYWGTILLVSLVVEGSRFQQIHRIRVPVCLVCLYRLRRMQRLAKLAILLGSMLMFLFVTYYQLPRVHGQTDMVLNTVIGLFVAFFTGLLFYLLIQANVLKLNTNRVLARFDRKTKRFHFLHAGFQAAFEELNQGGYYEPGYAVSFQQGVSA